MGQPPGSDDGRLEREKNMLNWAVIQTVYFSKFEKEREEIIARFDTCRKKRAAGFGLSISKIKASR